MNFKTNDYSPNLNYYLNISIIQILNYKITVFKIIILITILLLLIKPKYIIKYILLLIILLIITKILFICYY